MKDKVVLAYSCGLDTSIIIPWLKENIDKWQSRESIWITHDAVYHKMGIPLSYNKNEF